MLDDHRHQDLPHDLVVDWIAIKHTNLSLSISLLMSIGRACASIENHEEARVSEGVVG